MKYSNRNFLLSTRITGWLVLLQLTQAIVWPTSTAHKIDWQFQGESCANYALYCLHNANTADKKPGRYILSINYQVDAVGEMQSAIQPPAWCPILLNYATHMTFIIHSSAQSCNIKGTNNNIKRREVGLVESQHDRLDRGFLCKSAREREIIRLPQLFTKIVYAKWNINKPLEIPGG